MDMGYARVNLTYQGGLDQLREAFAGAGLTLSQSWRAVDARQGAMIRHLPNLLSALRLLAAPFAAWLILNSHDTAALLVFAAAGLQRWPGRLHCAALACDLRLRRLARSGGGQASDASVFRRAACRRRRAACGWWRWWSRAMAPLSPGWLLIKGLGLPIATRPLFLGKASTMVQVLYILAVLLLLAFDLDAPHLALAAAWVCGLSSFCRRWPMPDFSCAACSPEGRWLRDPAGSAA